MGWSGPLRQPRRAARVPWGGPRQAVAEAQGAIPGARANRSSTTPAPAALGGSTAATAMKAAPVVVSGPSHRSSMASGLAGHRTAAHLPRATSSVTPLAQARRARGTCLAPHGRAPPARPGPSARRVPVAAGSAGRGAHARPSRRSLLPQPDSPDTRRSKQPAARLTGAVPGRPDPVYDHSGRVEPRSRAGRPDREPATAFCERAITAAPAHGVVTIDLAAPLERAARRRPLRPVEPQSTVSRSVR